MISTSIILSLSMMLKAVAFSICCLTIVLQFIGLKIDISDFQFYYPSDTQRIVANNFIKVGILQKKILLRVTTRTKISDQLRFNNSWRTRFIKFALYSETGEENVFTLFILWVLFLFSNTVPFVVHDCSLMSFISMPFCELKKNFRWIFCFSQVSFGGYCWKVMSRFGFEFHQRFHQ